MAAVIVGFPCTDAAALHILAPNERDMLSEALAIEREQPLAVRRLLGSHAVEN